jgi:hypothetical protein
MYGAYSKEVHSKDDIDGVAIASEIKVAFDYFFETTAELLERAREAKRVWSQL